MNIQVTNEAVEWFKEEFNLSGEEEYIRFFARYGGCGSVQSGFSLGISREIPSIVGARVKKEGITFFIEDKDIWYFKGLDLHVHFNEANEEIEFHYTEQNEQTNS
ncbi:hypothetical protein GN156_00155 [bacterium LRH843]|nr:hypothetical protein [bacterium LRH843]